ncbi:hypothetical protein ERN12_05900 [Rhodobacteraceae bacterium]|nr:hypothetical protein ERN12_05900 [Paracoccaceae bacterium]
MRRQILTQADDDDKSVAIQITRDEALKVVIADHDDTAFILTIAKTPEAAPMIEMHGTGAGIDITPASVRDLIEGNIYRYNIWEYQTDGYVRWFYGNLAIGNSIAPTGAETPAPDGDDFVAIVASRAEFEALQEADEAAAVHAAAKNNPHGVTAAQVGLGHVNNTADADKPVSAAQRAALDALGADLSADDTRQVAAIRAGGVIPLGLSSIDGASYVATPDPAFTNLGIPTLPDGAQARFLIQTTNTVANPSVTINGTTFALRGADGETWPAGAFMRYRQYAVQRRGSTLRVVGGEVTMYDVKAATETGKLLNLVPVPGGGPLEFTVESGFDDTGVVPRAMLRFYPQDDVAQENPAFTINGVARQARDRDGGTLRADVLVKGTTYLAQISRGGSFVEIWPGTSFDDQAGSVKAIDDLTAHRTQTDAALSDLTGTQAALLTDVADTRAAVSREAGARASLIQRSGGENLFSFTDKNGDAVWGTVREEDGQWPEWAVGELDTRLGVSDQGAKISAVRDLIRPSQGRDLVSVMDRNGDAVWGTVRETDGQWPDWAVAELAERLGLRSSAVGGQDFHLKDGRYWPANCDMTRVLTIGSSTPWDMRDNINAMLATLETRAGQEITQTNLSQRGEWSTHTAARFGVIPARLTVTGNEIPSSGAVDCVSSNINEDRQRLRSYTGWLAGVYGTLASPDYTIQFTRAEAGDPVAVPPDAAFIPEVGPAFRDAVLFLSTGKNDITSGETAEVVEARVAQIVDYLGPLNARFLVFGDWTNTGTGADAAYRVQIDAVNRLRKARYGPLYVPIRDYITSDQVWRDARDLDPAFAGPTPEDYAEQALGNKPPSLSLDGGHLNDFGRRLVLTCLVKPQLIGLGWYKQKETT